MKSQGPMTNIPCRVRIIEGTVKSIVKNEASKQVLGVQYVQKGHEHQEYVIQLTWLCANS
jgi:hypothetical protein